MKAYIIKACAQSPYKEYKKYMAAPSQSIFSLAAATPKDVVIEMCEETVDMKVNFHSDADIIAIFFSTPDAYRGYEIADEFKKLGKTVVIGGLHAKFNQIEALKHANSLLIGECEGIWEKLLDDYVNGKTLNKIYERSNQFDLSKLNPYPTDLIPLSQYNYVWSVLVSRGCPNHCDFCLVNKFFKGMRYRPVDDVVEEIANCGSKIVELHSDNLTADREYAKELFTKLIPLKIKWVGETTISIADDDELLKLAAKSGLSYLLVGLETPSEKDLKEQGKGFVKIDKVKKQIAKLHDYGILVDSGMLFGFENHDKDIFKRTLNYINEINLDIPQGIIPIPFPGTSFYKRLDDEGKITTKDWSKYDGRHLVYKHNNLSEKEILDGIKYFEDKVYGLRRIVRYYKWMAKMGIETIK